MARTLIPVRDLGKRYRLGAHATIYLSLRDQISRWLEQGFRSKAAQREFWALRNVSFDVGEGEAVGLIGRNGAGKSTLLKLLSRITEPTEGEAHLRGKLASLLEVGIGFHPELSGRENVYLNGAILGMSRHEIRSRFDEIVGFAEIEKFLDTPVKRYSSGMYVRLAFAVAAHLESEVLLVDEVLAVGDAAFQRKCIGKMNDIRRQGRSILLVSHNMSIVSQLCEKVIWLSSGRVVEIGSSSTVIQRYLSEGVSSRPEWRPTGLGNDHFDYHSVSVARADGQPSGEAIPADVPIDIVFDFTINEGLGPGRLAFQLSNDRGVVVLASASSDTQPALNHSWRLGRQQWRCTVPGSLLAPGSYFLTVAEPIGMGDRIHENVLSFTVSEQNSLIARDGRGGIIAPVLPWEEI